MSEILSIPRRRWLQFSLRTMLLLVVVVSVPLAWKMNKVRTQRFVVAQIEKHGGVVLYEYNDDEFFGMPEGPRPDPPGPTWLREILGDDFFTIVTAADFRYGHPKTETLANLSMLPRLTHLSLESSDTTDTELAGIGALPALEYLNLSGNHVTESGLKNLRGLTTLVSLDLCSTDVGDGIGLADLKSLPSLRTLDLSYAKISDSGLIHLESLANLESLYLTKTGVTDVGLKHLQKITGLSKLILDGTKITDAGLVCLQTLPNLKSLSISDTIVTDAGIPHLKAMSGLTFIDLGGTQITREGMQGFHDVTLGWYPPSSQDRAKVEPSVESHTGD